MADIVRFPSDTSAAADVHEADAREIPGDRFLLDEGLELLADFRLIQNEDVRASLRKLVNSMASASRASAV